MWTLPSGRLEIWIIPPTMPNPDSEANTTQIWCSWWWFIRHVLLTSEIIAYLYLLNDISLRNMQEYDVAVEAMQLLGIRLSENGCFKTIFKHSRWTESAPMYAHPGCTIQSRISLTLGVSYPLPVVFQSGNSGQSSTIGWFRMVQVGFLCHKS